MRIGKVEVKWLKGGRRKSRPERRHSRSVDYFELTENIMQAVPHVCHVGGSVPVR